MVETKTTVENACALARDLGFAVHVESDSYVVLKRDGNELALTAKKIPLELAIAHVESGLFIQARYDAFVLFDTGDLDRFADEFVEKLES